MVHSSQLLPSGRVRHSKNGKLYAIGTAKVKSQVYEKVENYDLDEACATTEQAVKIAQKALLKATAVVRATIQAGTHVNFTFYMAPKKVMPKDKPEFISSNGWTNGYW